MDLGMLGLSDDEDDQMGIPRVGSTPSLRLFLDEDSDQNSSDEASIPRLVFSDTETSHSEESPLHAAIRRKKGTRRGAKLRRIDSIKSLMGSLRHLMENESLEHAMEVINYIMANYYYDQFFEFYLKKNFQSENYHFLKAVLDYSDNPSNQALTEINDNFICEGAPEEINVDSQTRKEVTSKVDEIQSMLFSEIGSIATEPPHDLFFEVYDEIYALLRKNSLIPFVKAPSFEAVKEISEGLVKDQDMTIIHRRAQQGVFKDIQRLLDIFPEIVDLKDKKGNTILHVAVQNTKIDFVLELVTRYKPNVNIQNEDGDTPLHIAARMDSLAMSKFLLKSRNTSAMIIPHLKNKEGMSFLGLCGKATRAIYKDFVMDFLKRKTEAAAVDPNVIYIWDDMFQSGNPKVDRLRKKAIDAAVELAKDPGELEAMKSKMQEVKALVEESLNIEAEGADSKHLKKNQKVFKRLGSASGGRKLSNANKFLYILNELETNDFLGDNN